MKERKQDRARFWKGIRMVWRMDRGLVVHSVLRALLQAAIPYVGILLSAYVLDGLQAGLRFEELLPTVVLALAAAFLLSCAQAYEQKKVAIHADRSGKTYDSFVSMKTLELDYPQLESPAANNLRGRILLDANWGAGFFSLAWILPELMNALFSCLISLGLLIPLLAGGVLGGSLAPLWLAAFLAVLVFSVAFGRVKTKQQYKIISDVPVAKSSTAGYFTSMDYHVGKDIRLYGAQPMVEQAMQAAEYPMQGWIRSIVRNNVASGFSSGFCAGLMQLFAYLLVTLRTAAGALTVGSLVRYAGVLYQFSQAAANLFATITEFTVAAGRLESTESYLDLEDVLQKGSLPVEKRAFCTGGDMDYEIECRDVSFRYPGSDRWVLRHVNLKFRVGERLAVVGRNGSGKTTFIKLLCRLYDPTEGEILLNGIDIRKYSYEEYLSLFSVVFQDFKLFSFELGQNVAASVEVDEGKAKACLEQAGFGERLRELPKGLHTCLYKDFEEDGVEISGGEAQKIALARALYKDAPFLVLDEPTAALDPVAEYEVYTGFNRMVGNRTAVYISHRLSSCRFCDEIAVFDEGCIVQRGSHESLLSQPDSLYARLWNAQAKYYRTSPSCCS